MRSLKKGERDANHRQHRDHHQKRTEKEAPIEALARGRQFLLQDLCLAAFLLSLGLARGARVVIPEAGAVTGRRHSLDYVILREFGVIELQRHVVFEKVDSDVTAAVERLDGFFHARRASRAAHPRDIKVKFLHLVDI